MVDPSGRGGIALYSELIAKALLDAGAEPRLLAGRRFEASSVGYRVLRRIPPLAWGRPARVGVGFYARRAWEWVGWAIVLLSASITERPDVVHIQAPVNRRLDAHLIRGLARRVPVVWTAHDVVPHESDGRDAGRFAEIYRAATLVIVHGPPAAAAVSELAGVQATVIAHPVAQLGGPIPRAEARRRLGLPVAQRVLAAVGFVRAYKGYDLLADVWEELGQDAPTLIVAGELMAESERSVLDRLNCCDKVLLRLGYLPDDEMRAMICAADAVLLPYRAGSDSGVLHLARALGVPVIASDAPHLAASVKATGAGAVLPRESVAWAHAIRGPLPPPPPPAPTLRATGRAHLRAYEQARARHRRATSP